MEVGLGAAYAVARALVSMKQVGLNVASDPFMAAAITGINAGMVAISADDPGAHGTQNEQDSRHFAGFAKVPVLEPSDIEHLVRSIGVSDVKVIDAFNIKALRAGVRSSLDSPELSVIIVRGACSVRVPRRSEPRAIDTEKCNRCGGCSSAPISSA
ncbi:MAG: hypothetical protein COS88_04815 [Chloroflexi bacterium CG07_land_8_20_14_0_80_51_10]|nr:MAG: hypothetical protein COS88_04815 [Chloroflexi bacterium CG07_land_8_20_14_0_80_51_10]